MYRLRQITRFVIPGCLQAIKWFITISFSPSPFSLLFFRINERKQTPIRQRTFIAEDAENAEKQRQLLTANTRQYTRMGFFISVHSRSLAVRYVVLSDESFFSATSASSAVNLFFPVIGTIKCYLSLDWSSARCSFAVPKSYLLPTDSADEPCFFVSPFVTMVKKGED